MSFDLNQLRIQLEEINSKMQDAENNFADQLNRLHPSNIQNGHNLLYYLVLRRMDIRALQTNCMRQDSLHLQKQIRIATRSEITDAAHAAFADCVMINKGTHTIRVLETLRDILQRSGGHHIKKRYIFGPLSIATQFISTKSSTITNTS